MINLFLALASGTHVVILGKVPSPKILGVAFKKVRPHDHIGQDVFFSVVKGEVITTLDGNETHTLTPGTLLRFPGEAMIGIEAIVDSEFYVYLINRRN